MTPIERLKLINHELTPEDIDNLSRSIQHKLDQGWLDDEIVAHLKCTEEVSPHLSEDVALTRMRLISARVKERIGS